MKTRVLVAVLVLLTVVNITGFGVMLVRRARSERTFRERGPLRHQLMRELDLTREQRRALRAFRSQFVERTQELRDSLHSTHRMLVAEMREAEPDLARIDSLVTRVAELQGKVQRVAVRSMLEEKRKLAPEQQEKLFRLYERFVERHRPMHDGGPLHRGRPMHGRGHGHWDRVPPER
ncbi:MAG: periplasmic heavy metal sensor [Chitinivibrionales bacterium]|nr:periplasmic heavy metal sensor [Chitinivibrionales bacterium]